MTRLSKVKRCLDSRVAFGAVFLWKPRIFFPRLLKLFSRRYYILMIRQTLEQTVGSRGRVGSDPREASTHQGRRSCSWERGHDCPGRGSLDPSVPREIPGAAARVTSAWCVNNDES